MALIQQIEHIYLQLDDDRAEKLGLFHVKDGRLVTPIADDVTSLFTYRSKRADGLIGQSTVSRLLAAIKASNGYKGINHIGFCYKVASKEDEIKRITVEARDHGYTAYQEPSNDDAAWIFVGDLSEITNPLLEFLPHEGQSGDQWIDYWLPHIQFDIDTGLSPDERSEEHTSELQSQSNLV